MLTTNKTNVLQAAALLLFVTPYARAQTDAFGYTATNSGPYSYVNIANTGTTVLADADDATAILTLPFSFRFYGVVYNSLCVSSNGLISFGSCVAEDFTNLDLTSQAPSGNQPLIAPFWSDLTFSVPGAGSVVYQTLGIAGSRQFIVQWSNVAILNVPGVLNFQAILFEGTNNILFQYQSVESTSSATLRGAGATVGIRAANGHVNNQRLSWSYNAPVLKNASAIRFVAPATSGPVDVSARVRVTTSAFVFNRLQSRYTGTLTLTNISSTSIARPITAVLTGLSTGVTALNATGLTANGPSYLAPGTAALAPNESVTIPLQFSNPSNTRISFVVKTYIGSF